MYTNITINKPLIFLGQKNFHFRRILIRIDAFQAILGGCQCIISKDKKHLFFEEETGILKTIDPWAGSTYVEKRTYEIATKSWLLFKESTF